MAAKLSNNPALKTDVFVDATTESVMADIAKRPVWEAITAISSEIPSAEWMKVPDDGSINYKHYLYGAPKSPA